MSANTARLGILGGMGPQATLTFYQRVLDFTRAETDQEHLPALIRSDTAIPDRTAAILSGKTDAVFAALLDGARRLEEAGCTVLAIPCNTSHFFADRLQAALAIPLLNMVRLTVAHAKQQGHRKLGILATDGTIQTALYQAECAAQGLDWAVPCASAQGAIMSMIYDEVKQSRPATPAKFALADEDLRGQQCDGVLIACTELSVYHFAHGVPTHCIDAVDVLARASVEACGYPLR